MEGNARLKAFLRTERTVADELLRFAKDEQVYLIVAGDYGHSRLGEWLFGGVTRDLLAKKLCVLPVFALIRERAAQRGKTYPRN